MAHLVQCEHQAEQVDQDPECVQDVMPVWTLAMIAMITVRGDTKMVNVMEGCHRNVMYVSRWDQ